MILNGVPRERRRYPSTERCPVKRDRVCSSSAGMGAAVVVVGATEAIEDGSNVVDVYTDLDYGNVKQRQQRSG
jgi:hypothetical protein